MPASFRYIFADAFHGPRHDPLIHGGAAYDALCCRETFYV